MVKVIELLIFKNDNNIENSIILSLLQYIYYFLGIFYFSNGDKYDGQFKNN